MDLIKYDMTDIWAVAGDVVAPEGAKIRAGWGVEVVPRQWWNWFENRQDNNIAYLLQKGIPEWDSTTEYINNKSYVQRNNITYKSIKTGVNQDPISAPTYWVKAFVESSAYLESVKGLAVGANLMAYTDANGLAAQTPLTSFARSILDDANAAGVRDTISAQLANVNLTGLSSLASSSNTIPYFTGSGLMALTGFTGISRTFLANTDVAGMRNTLGLGNSATLNIGTSANTVAAGNDSRIVGSLQSNNNLSELTNPITARSNLGLTSTATTLLTTTNVDGTQGRVLKVGDFGVGSEGVLVGNIDTLTAAASGFYRLGTPYTGAPVAGSAFTVIQQAYDNERTQIATQEGAAVVRQFVRKYSSGQWSPWQEIYHTGNTSSIVNQVQSSIQSTLDGKLDKTGGTMTGVLFSPAVELGNSSVSGFLDFHNSGTSTDFDARISVSGGTSGVLNYNAAGGHIFTGPITGTISSAQSLLGNIPISQVTSLQGVLDAKMPSTGGGTTPTFSSTRVTSTWSGAGGNLSQGMSFGWNSGDAPGMNGEGNFVVNRGSGSGGFTWRSVTSNASVTGPVMTYSFDGNLSVPGSIKIGTTGLLSADGNIVGTAWGGYLSTFLTNNYTNRSNIANDIVTYASSTGAVGTYALLRNKTGSAVFPTGTTAGTLAYASTTGAESGSPGGTWRAMGYAANGDITLWVRIS